MTTPLFNVGESVIYQPHFAPETHDREFYGKVVTITSRTWVEDQKCWAYRLAEVGAPYTFDHFRETCLKKYHHAADQSFTELLASLNKPQTEKH